MFVFGSIVGFEEFSIQLLNILFHIGNNAEKNKEIDFISEGHRNILFTYKYWYFVFSFMFCIRKLRYRVSRRKD